MTRHGPTVLLADQDGPLISIGAEEEPMNRQMGNFEYRLRFYSRSQWRESIARWIAWHLPRDVAYWALIRVQVAGWGGNPADRPVVDAMESWRTHPDD